MSMIDEQIQLNANSVAPMNYVPQIRAAGLLVFVEFLRTLGTPVDRILCESRMPLAGIEHPDGLIPLYNLQLFLGKAARREGLPTLGLEATHGRTLDRLGSFGSLVLRSLTLYEALVKASRMITAFNSGVRMWLDQQGDQIWIRHRNLTAPSPGRDQLDQAAAALILTLLRCPDHQDGRPAELHLRLKYDRAVAGHPAFADLPLRFEKSATAFAVSSRLLSRPLSVSGPAGTPQPSGELARLRKTVPSLDLANSLRQMLLWQLKNRRLGIQLTAESAGMSVRTMQSRLCEEGFDYSRLVDEVRFDLVVDLLADPTVKLAEIANILCYSNAANFTRAFRRWTGVTPSVFRQQRLQEP